MKAVVMERYGAPDVLKLRDVNKPVPKANECLVRVHAASINDWDWELLRGAPLNRMMSGLFKPRLLHTWLRCCRTRGSRGRQR